MSPQYGYSSFSVRAERFRHYVPPLYYLVWHILQLFNRNKLVNNLEYVSGKICDKKQTFLFSWSHVCLITMSHFFFMVASVETQAELFTLYLGDRLDLSCSARDSHDAVNWTKDHVTVVDGEHTRIRNGQMEIEAVELTDSGLYACTTFGNHSVFFNVTGKVLSPFQREIPYSHRNKSFFFKYFPWFPPVNLNMYPPTVYNHIDAVIIWCGWDPDPPFIMESDKVTFFVLNFKITICKWRTLSDFCVKVIFYSGLLLTL